MKRFYKTAACVPEGQGWRVTLDGRPVKTATGRPQVVFAPALARAMVREWADQDEEIDAARFALRDMADYAIDIVAPDREGAIAALLPFLETDTLCYRADEGEALHDRQLAVWEPLLTDAERRWDVHFMRMSGVMHRAQPAETLARITGVLRSTGDFQLAALNTLSSLAASLIVGLAAMKPDADAEALWHAANLEEDWQAELWGKDDLAEQRREHRFASFAAAMRFARLAGQE